MNKRDKIVTKQYELSRLIQRIHKDLQSYEKEKINDLAMLKAAWKSHDLKGIERFAHSLAFDKEILAKRQRELIDCKAKIKLNKIQLKNIPHTLVDIYDNQEELNQRRNVLKMDILPRCHKHVEESKLALKNAIESGNPYKITEAGLELCGQLDLYKDRQNELISIRSKMNENHSRIRNLKRKEK